MNINTLLMAATRPLPFEPSERNIWTDPWIAKGMLDAHLDDTTDAASRAPAQRERAIGWIEGLSPGRRPRILDLGCGPGLYAEAFAARGCEVTGMDLSPSSIEYAHSSASAKGLEIDYRCGNYLTAELGSGCALAMMIYCDFGALSPADAELLLGRVRDALAPGGLFVFDVLGPAQASQKPARTWQVSAGPGFWSPKPHLVLEEHLAYPEERCFARQDIVLVEDEEPAIYRTWDRWFDEVELRQLLADHGFEIVEIRADLVAKNDFGSDDVLFIAARRSR